MIKWEKFYLKFKNLSNFEKRALKDLNPRHLILETSVLPTELRTLIIYCNYKRSKMQYFKFNLLKKKLDFSYDTKI